MKTRASQEPRSRWRTWAVVAALIPAGVGRAGDLAADPAGRPGASPPATASAPEIRQAAPATRPVKKSANGPTRTASREGDPTSLFSTLPAQASMAIAPSVVDAQARVAAADVFRDLDQALDPEVRRAGCATCGGFHSSSDAAAFHAPMGCTDGTCIPGRGPCYTPRDLSNCTLLGEFRRNLYECLCCPDPCYQPRWVPAANASFFADYARPRTITRIRYDNLTNLVYPDRNQYFVKSLPINTNNPFVRNGNRFRSNPSARLQQAYLYQEVAGEKGSFFIETVYRQINPLFSPTQAGFSDLNFGIKSLLYDCEMLQVSLQFRTYTPTGDSSKALGTGHFSLEPSLLASLKLTESTYFQAQVGNWIPIGTSNRVAGGVLFWFMSLNQVIYRRTPDSPLVATLEMDGWSFEDGGFTRPIVTPGLPAVRSDGGGVSYFNIGPGLRQTICNKFDYGGAVTFATGSGHWAEPWFRFEVRFMF